MWAVSCLLLALTAVYYAQSSMRSCLYRAHGSSGPMGFPAENWQLAYIRSFLRRKQNVSQLILRNVLFNNKDAIGVSFPMKGL